MTAKRAKLARPTPAVRGRNIKTGLPHCGSGEVKLPCRRTGLAPTNSCNHGTRR